MDHNALFFIRHLSELCILIEHYERKMPKRVPHSIHYIDSDHHTYSNIVQSLGIEIRPLNPCKESLSLLNFLTCTFLCQHLMINS